MPMHSVYGDALDMKGVASVRTLISSPQSAGKMIEVVIFIDEGRHGVQWILKRLTIINKLIWVKTHHNNCANHHIMTINTQKN